MAEFSVGSCDSSLKKEKLEDIVKNYLNDNFIEDGNLIGYFDELETFSTIIQKMKENGFTYSVRDSDMRKKGKCGMANENEEKIEMSQHTVFYQLKAMSIKFFGLPFTVEKTTHYHCAYGRKYYKSRAGGSKQKSEEGTNTLPVKKRRNVISKKMGCIAKMTLKKIIVYPQYKLEVETDWRQKKKKIECLRRDLFTMANQVENLCRYYLSVSIQSSHNHPPIMTSSLSPEKSRRMHKPSHRLSGKRNESEQTNEPKWDSFQTSDSEQRQLSIPDTNFLSTLVKFPGDVAYETHEIKPMIELNAFPPDESRTFQIQYHPSIPDLHAIFREKLKRLYTACENCFDSTLLLRLVSDLEQMEGVLNNEIAYDANV